MGKWKRGKKKGGSRVELGCVSGSGIRVEVGGLLREVFSYFHALGNSHVAIQHPYVSSIQILWLTMLFFF